MGTISPASSQNASAPLLLGSHLPCLPKANDTCIFPFTYNGVEYYRCTYADSPTPWCATMVDPNNTVVTNRWGDCSTSQFSNCPEDTPDLPSCTAESGASRVFPFRHEGRFHRIFLGFNHTNNPLFST